MMVVLMAEFLRIVGEVEKKEGRRYLDVVDCIRILIDSQRFKCEGHDECEMLVGPNLDTLSA